MASVPRPTCVTTLCCTGTSNSQPFFLYKHTEQSNKRQKQEVFLILYQVKSCTKPFTFCLPDYGESLVADSGYWGLLAKIKPPNEQDRNCLSAFHRAGAPLRPNYHQVLQDHPLQAHTLLNIFSWDRGLETDKKKKKSWMEMCSLTPNGWRGDRLWFMVGLTLVLDSMHL